MSFESPLALLALLLVPLAVAGYVVYDRRRTADAARFASPPLLPNIVTRWPRWRRHVPIAILLVAVTALLVGFARPHAEISVPREEATVVLALDVSRSMAAKDVRPTRLRAAQAAARRFIKQVPDSFRIGVVTFATRARVVAPATDDRAFVRAALKEVRTGEGTALGEAIALSLDVGRAVRGEKPGERPPTSVLVMSDGAQTVGEITPDRAAQRARRLGIPIYTVALGTENGIVVRQLPGGFRARIRVPPDPRSLRRVAASTGGEFFTATDDKRLSRVYEELESRLGRKKKRAEITVAFAGAGGLLLLAAGALSTVLFRRLP